MSSRLMCSEPITKKTAFNRKAVALISGGLDSTLAIYLDKATMNRRNRYSFYFILLRWRARGRRLAGAHHCAATGRPSGVHSEGQGLHSALEGPSVRFWKERKSLH